MGNTYEMDVPSPSHTPRILVGTVLAALVAAAVAVALLVPAAGAADTRRSANPASIGIFDDTEIVHGDPALTFPLLRGLNTGLVRATLWWGGPNGVARTSPTIPTDPADPAYDWAPYDRLVRNATTEGITVLFTLLGTPSWANGGRGWNRAPDDPTAFGAFAQAAATRYGGAFAVDGTALPAVNRWMIWNEPNNPVFLRPQYVREGGRWVVQSARDYAALCNAAVTGIRAGQRGARIACGGTAPRGNNAASSSRPSVSPIAFLTAMRAAGARGFDAYAHHPYYGKRQETPSTPPPAAENGAPATAVTLGNIDRLEAALDRTYGRRKPLWITEYGYQTSPPDLLMGVTLAEQARYLRQAVEIVRADPRIQLFVWFRLRDEEPLTGWQSGLFAADGTAKPARAAFAAVSAG